MMEKKEQKIRMRMRGSPLKHDGVLLDCSVTENWFKVRFDGPLDDTTFYRWDDNLVTDKLVPTGEAPPTCGARIWEVL